MNLIKILSKIPYFKNQIAKVAFEIKYIDPDDAAKMKYSFTTSDGKKWYTYIKPDLIPIVRWNEIETRVMEMTSRVNRETLLEFSKTCEAAAEKKDFLTVARLMGELRERMEMLYDPHALIRIVCAMYVREDQTKSDKIWNEELEEGKFKVIKGDLESGALTFFLIERDLKNVMTFSDTSNGDFQIFEKSILKNQIKQTEVFDKMLQRLRGEITKQG